MDTKATVKLTTRNELIRTRVSARSSIPIVVIPGSEEPKLMGREGGMFRSGTRIAVTVSDVASGRCSAYDVTVVESTLRVVVGVEWVHQNY